MLRLLLIAVAASAVSATPVQTFPTSDWNPTATQLLTQRSSFPATPTIQQTPTTSFQQMPMTPFQQTPTVSGQATHLLAVPISRDLNSGLPTAFYQQPVQTIQARDFASNLAQMPMNSINQQPVQTVQARDFATNLAQMPMSSINQQPVQTVQARDFATNLAQMPMSSVNQMPMSTFNQMPMANSFGQMPVSRQATLTTDRNVNNLANRNFAVKPENAQLLGRDATVTWINQEDGTSLLLINNTHKHDHADDQDHIQSSNWTSETVHFQNATSLKTSNDANIQKTPGHAAPLPIKESSYTKWDNTGIASLPVVAAAVPKGTTSIDSTIIQAKPVVEFQPAKQSSITSSFKDYQLGIKPSADWSTSNIDTSKMYVFDILAPPVIGSQLVKLVAEAVPGKNYPALTEIPETSFTCNEKKIAGYYADVETNCQVFRRCDTEGQKTDYLCPEKTVFNQVTLTCDWWFNVDCPSSPKFERYANSRLYTDLPLFDTPPKDYIPRWVNLYFEQLHNERKINDAAFERKHVMAV